MKKILLVLISFALAVLVSACPTTDGDSTALSVERAKVAEALYLNAIYNEATLNDGIEATKIAVLDEIYHRYVNDDSPEVRFWAAAALTFKAVVLIEQGKREAAIVVLDEISRSFGNDESPKVRFWAANALGKKANPVKTKVRYRVEEVSGIDVTTAIHAEADYREVERRFADTAVAHGFIDWIRFNKAEELKIQGKLDAAIAIYDELIRKIITSDVPVPAEIVEMVFMKKSLVLWEQGKVDVVLATWKELVRFFEPYGISEAQMRGWGVQTLADHAERQNGIEAVVNAYDKIDRHFSSDNAPEVRKQIAKAISNKADALERQNNNEAAIAAYDEATRRFSNDESPLVRYWAAYALHRKAKVLREPKAAIAVYDEISRRFGTDDSPAVRYWAVSALIDKAEALREQDELDAAIALYDEAARRLADTPEARGIVVDALVHKAEVLKKQGKLDAAIASYDEVVRQLITGTDDGVVPGALEILCMEKSLILWEQGKVDAVLTTWKELARFFEPLGIASEAEIRFEGVKMLIDQAEKQVKQAKNQDELAAAFAAYDKVARHFDNVDYPDVRKLFAAAHEVKADALVDFLGNLLEEQDKFEAALAAYDEFARRFGNNNSTEARSQAARALVAHANDLMSRDEFAAAIVAYDEILRRFTTDNAPGVRAQVAEALVGKAIILKKQNKFEAAISTCDEVIRRFGDNDSSEMRDLVEEAQRYKNEIMSKK